MELGILEGWGQSSVHTQEWIYLLYLGEGKHQRCWKSQNGALSTARTWPWDTGMLNLPGLSDLS
jgi:hypothetical protein